MKAKDLKVETHLSQSVYSLTIVYRDGSRIHRHVLMFAITDDKSLVEEVNDYVRYSKNRLFKMFPGIKDSRLISYEVSLVPPYKYTISSAIRSCSILLSENIFFTSYGSHVTKFFYEPWNDCIDDDDDVQEHDDLPF